MPTPRIPDEYLVEAVRLKQEHTYEIEACKYATDYLNNKTGISRHAFQRRMMRAAEKGFTQGLPEGAVAAGYSIKKHSTTLDENGQIKTQSIQTAKEHGEEFEVPEGHKVKGYSALVDADGRTVQQWIKTREELDGSLDHIKAAFENFEPCAEIISPPKATLKELCTVYPIADHHIGALAWNRETEQGSYDLSIATERLRDTARRLISRAYPSETALIMQLGDYFHIDDQQNATPANKNQLDVDGRYQKVVWAGVFALRDTIDLALQRHAKVTVVCLPGNHDPHSSFALTMALELYYKDNPRVTVETTPSEFYFHRFGVTLLGAHHGHRAKPEALARLLAELRPDDWAASKHRWFLTGHIHQDTVKDIGSVRYESFRTLASKDAWAAANAYTTPMSMQAITLQDETGEWERHRANIWLK